MCTRQRHSDQKLFKVKRKWTEDDRLSVCCLQVNVKDTVGCGDSFAAAIALGFTRCETPEATLALANAVGAATATGRGGFCELRWLHAHLARCCRDHWDVPVFRCCHTIAAMLASTGVRAELCLCGSRAFQLAICVAGHVNSSLARWRRCKLADEPASCNWI